MSRIPVFVYGPDPISQAGVVAQLRARPEITIVDDDPDRAEIAVIALERIDAEAMRATRAVQRNGCPRVVLVVGAVEESDLLGAMELGVAGLVRRQNASPERLVETITLAARGEASVPPDLVERLLRQFKHMHDHVLVPANMHASGLTNREIEVLSLVADGNDTREIADELCYSERTIKNVIQDVTRRFGLRNRSHAVAYALRNGLI